MVVTRWLRADLTTAALLVSSTAAIELWPGVHPRASGRGALRLDAEAPGGTVSGLGVRLDPPRREPTSFVIGFSVSGASAGAIAGRLVLRYDPGPGSGPVGTLAQLTLDSDGDAEGLAPLREDAEQFLSNLAEHAESRSESTRARA